LDKTNHNKEHLKTHVPQNLGQKFERLQSILEVLREDCPWDKKQTPESLVHLTLEETYEMIEAIDTHNDPELRKELGDLLLHINFQALMAGERQAFTISDVLDAISEKLIYRHPHVFGNEQADNEAKVKTNWERLKMKEGRTSVLEGVPMAMPEPLRAYRTQEKAAGVGFDWDKKEEVWQKLMEELQEFQQAQTEAEREEELGDILFTLVNYSRFIKTNPEDALRKATNKFRERFLEIEKAVKQSQKPWSAYSLAELDKLWDEAKRRLKGAHGNQTD
jgi:XTP/dITP diphosphohydrolase